MARSVFLPIAPLAPFVRHIMAGGFENDLVHLPTCADVQLLVYLEGGASLIDPSGADTALPAVFLVGAVAHPRLYRVQPNSRFIAVTFRPGAVYACFGMSAAEVTGRIVPFHTTAAMQDVLARAGPAAPERLQAMLQRGLAARRIAPLPALDPDTLSQPVRTLARQLGISVRHFERRCLVSLGMPLREYRRLARYSAAMTALMMQGAAPHSLADLALQAGYVDQAHLTRDFSVLVGSPPGRFGRERSAARYQLWQFTRDELESYLS